MCVDTGVKGFGQETLMFSFTNISGVFLQQSKESERKLIVVLCEPLTQVNWSCCFGVTCYWTWLWYGLAPRLAGTSLY